MTKPKTTPKHPGGRPPKYSKELVKKLEDSLKNGFSIKMACRLSKISTQTYYNWLSQYPEFLDEMTFAHDFAEENARQIVHVAINKDRDLQTAKWYLERKAPNEFSNKTRVDASIVSRREPLSEEEVDRLTKELIALTKEEANVDSQTDTEQSNPS